MQMYVLILVHVRFTLTEVKELVYKGFEKVTPDRWQSLIRHVQEKVNSSYLCLYSTSLNTLYCGGEPEKH